MQYFPFLLRFKRSLSPLFLWFSDMAHARTTKKWAVRVFMVSLSKFLLLFVCFGAYPLASWRDVRRGDWNIEQFSHSWTKQQQRSHAQETSLSLFSPWSVCENAGKTSLLNIISLFFFLVIAHEAENGAPSLGFGGRCTIKQNRADLSLPYEQVRCHRGKTPNVPDAFFPFSSSWRAVVIVNLRGKKKAAANKFKRCTSNNKENKKNSKK